VRILESKVETTTVCPAEHRRSGGDARSLPQGLTTRSRSSVGPFLRRASGCSTPAALRRHFEVDAAHIVVAGLVALTA